jgi:hypothetical protein
MHTLAESRKDLRAAGLLRHRAFPCGYSRPFEEGVFLEVERAESMNPGPSYRLYPPECVEG